MTTLLVCVLMCVVGLAVGYKTARIFSEAECAALQERLDWMRRMAENAVATQVQLRAEVVSLRERLDAEREEREVSR